MILDSDLHRLEPSRRHERPTPRPVQIEDDVWIGAQAIVLRGVRIGYGSVVAAGSVVTRSVPAMSVVAGNPARVVRRIQDSGPAPRVLPDRTNGAWVARESFAA